MNGEVDKEKVREGYLALLRRHLLSALQSGNSGGQHALRKMENKLHNIEL